MKQKRHNRMKLTKTQLRQIIREEIQSLNEGISQGDLELTRDGKLNYAGKTIDGDFNCSFNSLKTLEGAPKSVGGGFYCNDNKLTSLEGAPKSVGGFFDCSDNKLKTLKGIEGLKCANLFLPKSILAKNGGFIEDEHDVEVNYNVKAKSIDFE